MYELLAIAAIVAPRVEAASPEAVDAAQTPAASAASSAQPPTPVFRPINHDEDYSVLADPALQTTAWTRIKYIPISGDSYMTLGGELRLRTEWREGERWGRGPQDDNGDFQQRTRLWGDLHLGRNLRAFVDIQHATSHDFDTTVAITEVGRTDVHQALVETWGEIGDAAVRLRVGRQEMGLGGFRLFDMREGANARRALDLARLTVSRGRWSGEAFTGWAVRESPASFDDASNRDYDVSGANVGRAFGAATSAFRVEATYVATDRARAAFDSSTGHDQRQTLSLRWAGREGPWDYDVEGLRQWGDHADLDIEAWYVSVVVGHNLVHDWKPRIALRFDAASGDKNPADGELGVYAPLFPRPLTYNGDLGPHNQIVVQPMLAIQPHPRLNLDFSTAGLWRASTADGVYALSGLVLVQGGQSDARYIGQRFTAAGRYALNPFTTLGFYVNHTTPGDVFKDTGVADGLLYAATYLTFRF